MTIALNTPKEQRRWSDYIDFERGPKSKFPSFSTKPKYLRIKRTHYYDEDDRLSFWKTVSGALGVATLIKYLRNIDGIDEVAAAFNQIKTVAGPIAASNVFFFGSPFVIFGFLGMIEEQAEAREELQELFTNRDEDNPKKLVEEIYAIVDKHFPNNYAIRKKNIMEYGKEALVKIAQKAGESGSEDLVKLSIFLNTLYDDKKTYVAKWLDHYSARYFGLHAMGLMALGMFAGLAESLNKIAYFEGASTEALVDGFDLATTGIFAPANTLMAIYGAFRCYSGLQYQKKFKRDINALENLKTNLSAGVSENALIHQEKMRKYDYRSRVRYGYLTALGQSMIAYGGWGSLGIVTIPATLPITFVGVVIAVAAVVERVDSEYKMEAFSGDDEKIIESDEFDEDELIEEIKDKKSFEETVKIFNDKVDHETNESVRLKMLSLAVNLALKGGNNTDQYQYFLKLCSLSERGKYTNNYRDWANKGIFMYSCKRLFVGISNFLWINLTSMPKHELQMLNERKTQFAQKLYFDKGDYFYTNIVKETLNLESNKEVIERVKEIYEGVDKKNEKDKQGNHYNYEYNKFINNFVKQISNSSYIMWCDSTFIKRDSEGMVTGFDFEHFAKMAENDPTLMEEFCKSCALYVVKYEKNASAVRRTSAVEGLVKVARMQETFKDARISLPDNNNDIILDPTEVKAISR